MFPLYLRILEIVIQEFVFAPLYALHKGYISPKTLKVNQHDIPLNETISLLLPRNL
jgi:hypothetical protein